MLECFFQEEEFLMRVQAGSDPLTNVKFELVGV